jgi:hypothetical protein
MIVLEQGKYYGNIMVEILWGQKYYGVRHNNHYKLAGVDRAKGEEVKSSTAYRPGEPRVKWPCREAWPPD